MGEPFVGEIRMFGGNFAPAGWMFCSGQLLPISENETLFQLIGTTYGGDGQSTFALPDLRGRLPVHLGNGFTLAQTGGTEEVTLTTTQIPAHGHSLSCSSGGQATSSNPQAGVWAPSDVLQYSTQPPDSQMGNPAISSDSAGGSQPHTNFMPYLCINFIISLFGVFPSPT
jgi:microcystin-dependent protein